MQASVIGQATVTLMHGGLTVTYLTAVRRENPSIEHIVGNCVFIARKLLRWDAHP